MSKQSPKHANADAATEGGSGRFIAWVLIAVAQILLGATQIWLCLLQGTVTGEHPVWLFSDGVFIVLGFGYLFARPWRRKPPTGYIAKYRARCNLLAVLATLAGILGLISGLTALVTWNATSRTIVFTRAYASTPRVQQLLADLRRSEAIRRWVPTVATPLLILTAALLGRAWYRATRRVARLQTQHCEQCGYSLRGLSEPRCPECGTSFNPNRAGQGT